MGKFYVEIQGRPPLPLPAGADASSYRLIFDPHGAQQQTRRLPQLISIDKTASFFLRVQLSLPYVATGHTSAFISRIFVEVGTL